MIISPLVQLAIDTLRTRETVTVFAEVDAINERDGAHILEDLIRSALPQRVPHQVQTRVGTRTVLIHDITDTGAAAGNGYLRIIPGSTAFN